MTTESLNRNRGGVSVDDRNESARRAVRVFRSMQFGLTSYARALTGDNKVSVEIASGTPRTDGKKIMYQPPIALGDLSPHERILCDKRDSNTLLLLCPACNVREEVLVNIYHEIGHLAFDSFAETTDYEKRQVTKRAIDEWGTKYADKIKAKIDSMSSSDKNSYFKLANIISPYLPFLFNALEDVRVDLAMINARKGIRIMMEASTMQIFRDAEEGTSWRDAPLNSQVSIACYLEGCKLVGWKDYLHPKVVEAFRDPELLKLLDKFHDIKTASETYALSFPILTRLRELGYFELPEDQEQENGKEGQSDPDAVPDESDNKDSSSNESSGDSEATSEPDLQPEQEDPSSGGDQTDEGDKGDGDSQEDGGEDSAPDSNDSSNKSEVGNQAPESETDGEPNQSNDSQAGDNGDANSSADEPQQSDSGSSKLVDTGAFNKKDIQETDQLNYGEPADVKEILEQLHHSNVTVQSHEEENSQDDSAIQVAIVQGMYFEKPSTKIGGVREHYFNQYTVINGRRLDQAWAHARYKKYDINLLQLGINIELSIPESILGPALLKTRRVFTDNAVAKYQNNLRSGRINKRVLGQRAWGDDDRLFSKKRILGKRSYAVLIGIDVSGSTLGANIALAKRAAWGQAELCHRAGIDFAMYAHSASGTHGEVGRNNELWLDIYHIKDFGQSWDKSTQQALHELGSDSENLDGHTLEYYRKAVAKTSATDKILLYYTDGKMPAANHAEELEILQREIKYCKRDNITLLGVGIRTDSPKRHGLDTVQVDNDEDIKSVVLHLEKELVRRG